MPNVISLTSFSVFMTTRQLDLKCMFGRYEYEKKSVRKSRIYNKNERVEITELNVLFS